MGEPGALRRHDRSSIYTRHDSTVYTSEEILTAERRILADLFSGSYKTMEVLKLKDIVNALEKTIDALESLANTVEQIAVKES